MNLTDLVYQDAEKTFLLGMVDGLPFVAPPNSRIWRLAHDGDQEQGIDPAPITDYAPPSPNVDDIYAEGDRREALFLSTALGREVSVAEMERLRREGGEEAVELNDKGQGRNAKENARADQLRQFRAGLKAVRIARDDLLALDRIPADYKAAKRWPGA